MAKTYHIPKIPMWRGTWPSQREMIKSKVEEKAGQKKEKWQEGCLDGNAGAAAFSGAWAVYWENCPIEALLCVEPILLNTLGTFF